ncbi:MAG: hypothetical protein DMG59_23810 [Acidobacteria bacterium]|jgi:hypothetical protein|nr:MAG: hypothetical protein DMG59_23810 [Acidobacteriota bacterium]
MSYRSYRLTKDTAAILAADNKQDIVTVPSGGVITIAGVAADGMVEALWAGKKIRLFAIDVEQRGELVSSQGA